MIFRMFLSVLNCTPVLDPVVVALPTILPFVPSAVNEGGVCDVDDDLLGLAGLGVDDHLGDVLVLVGGAAVGPQDSAITKGRTSTSFLRISSVVIFTLKCTIVYERFR